MNIKDIMITDVIVITPEHTINEALQLMLEKKIRHLPVVNGDNDIIGIISDRDIRDASPSVFETDSSQYLHKPVKEIMVTDVMTALPYDFVEEAAYTMTEYHISCLPIEEDGKLIGIITEKDLLRTLVKLTGADLPSSRLEVEVPNITGMLSEVASLVKLHNINIQSVLVYPSKEVKKKILVFRLQGIDLRRLTKSLKEKGYSILWPNDMEMKE
ncbi:acetoin utilization AcuB family protein [Evansella sp. AB-rgal1]|uniref:acetoin utilization AcuB family protein n=1 Tax=Evansella sp. AB-rgal1 TaxID=3242696 RepID=UPI00359E1547